MTEPPPGHARPALNDPAILLATWFGSGLLPKAPGTWGSLAALPCGALLAWLGGPWLLLAAALLVLALGIWASERASAAMGKHDPGAVVIDEVVGQWLALLPVAEAYLFYLPAFVAFPRLRHPQALAGLLADRKLPGGWGIMLDDVIAGIYAAILVAALAYWFG